jgi:hypothetical protein
LCRAVLASRHATQSGSPASLCKCAEPAGADGAAWTPPSVPYGPQGNRLFATQEVGFLDSLPECRSGAVAAAHVNLLPRGRVSGLRSMFPWSGLCESNALPQAQETRHPGCGKVIEDVQLGLNKSFVAMSATALGISFSSRLQRETDIRVRARTKHCWPTNQALQC